MMIDVLIIGSGIAGLTAALNSSENKSKVLVLSKTFPTHSQSVQAQGGINAVLYDDNDDSIETHIEDTYKASCYLANKEHIKLMCQKAKETISWLDSIGVPFNRTNEDKIAQRKFGGTKKARTCYSSDYTGLKILHTLYDKCINKNITFKNEHLLLDLIIEENQCLGVTAFDIKEGIVKEFLSKTVIIASGGYAGIYSNNTTNSYSNTGDSIAIAYKAGVELSNLEFIQFHPTTLEESHILISESARGEGGYLLDKNHNRFIDELKPRDEVARAIFKKNQNDEKVYLDLRHLGLNKIMELIPQERKLALEFSAIKIEEELLPITPAAHYSMGGIKTDINSQTNIKNLYACGECAQSFIHGANRLGGNSLLEIVTFGKIAGVNALKTSKTVHPKTIMNQKSIKSKKEIDEIYLYPNLINFYTEKERISNLLFKNLGLFRDKSQMTLLLEELKELKLNIRKMGIGDKTVSYNKNLVEFIEFINMIDVSILVCSSALKREESRGSHFRTDFPLLNKDFEKASLTKSIDKEIVIRFEDIK